MCKQRKCYVDRISTVAIQSTFEPDLLTYPDYNRSLFVIGTVLALSGRFKITYSSVQPEESSFQPSETVSAFPHLLLQTAWGKGAKRCTAEKRISTEGRPHSGTALVCSDPHASVSLPVPGSSSILHTVGTLVLLPYQTTATDERSQGYGAFHPLSFDSSTVVPSSRTSS